MLTCAECKIPISGDDKLTYDASYATKDADEPIKYLHYPVCSRLYFNKKTEAHIIRGEN
jgi:hypothetical protein